MDEQENFTDIPANPYPRDLTTSLRGGGRGRRSLMEQAENIMFRGTPRREHNLSIQYIHDMLGEYQSPDILVITKQRSEGRVFKGYFVTATWAGREEELDVAWDITKEYTRTIGDHDKIPRFTPGRHIFRDDLQPARDSVSEGPQILRNDRN